MEVLARLRRSITTGRIAVNPTPSDDGLKFKYFTTAWNTLEGLIAIAAGVIAGSISLVGFGVDSFIEVTSGVALLWRMSADADEHRRERIERITLRIVGACFLALAVYVGYEAAADLLRKKAPEHSLPGIILACVSLVVMPLLSRAKRGVASNLDETRGNSGNSETRGNSGTDGTFSDRNSGNSGTETRGQTGRFLMF